MVKKFFYYFSILIFLLIVIIFYLSFFGIHTDKFNNNLSKRIKEAYPKINIEFSEIKLLLNPLNFTIKLETENPKIASDNIELKLESISSEYNFAAFFKKEFGINNINISTKVIEIKDLIKLLRLTEDNIQLFLLQKAIKNGQIIINAKFNFDQDGKIKEDIKLNGGLYNLSLKLLNDNDIKNINTIFNYDNRTLVFEKTKLKYLDIELSSNKISITENDKLYNVKGDFNNKKTNLSKKVLELFFQKQEFDNIILSTESNFSLNISKEYKFSNINLISNINLDQATWNYKNEQVKKFIPVFDNKIKLNDHKITFKYDKKFNLNGKGKFEINNNQDEIEYNLIKNNDQISYFVNILLDNTPLKLDFLNYEKKENFKSNLEIKAKKIKNNFTINELLFNSKNASFFSNLIEFDKNFKIVKFDNIKLNYTDTRNLKNDLNIANKNSYYSISAENFAFDKIVEEALTGDNKQKNKFFTKEKKLFKINIGKAYIDKDHDLTNLKGDFLIVNNEIETLNLTSNFTENKNVNLSVKTLNDIKVTTFYSELAKPFVKKFKFIKGFEEGQINFSSTTKNNISNSKLNIYDFKLKEIPTLTKILTLASLQGISDLLTGEGIRFDEFEMIFTNEKNLMQINEIYSIGPAISILMEGYIQKNELVSLKGTLVPATTINKFVASIPLLGDILVGKKTGEGVFGVSFKIKGPPKDLKTTVNPIKTLTPRFITRTLEKIKKNN